MNKPVSIIVNPAAGHGAMGKQLKAWRNRLQEVFADASVQVTAGRGEAGTLARQAFERGCRTIIACGGNGTANEVADALLGTGADAETLPELALVPVGVGIDLARSLGLPRLTRDLMVLMKTGAPRTVDAGRVTYRDERGEEVSRHFINIASAGISAGIAASVNAIGRRTWLPGSAVYFLKSARAVIGHRFAHMTVQVDGSTISEGETALVAVANGRFFGSGMAIAPEARMDDGLFDVVIVRSATKMHLLDNFNRIYSGAHRNLPEVTIVKGRSVRIDSAAPAPFEIDGETPGMAPLAAEVVPKALRIRA